MMDSTNEQRLRAAGFRGETLQHGDDGYDAARAVWNAMVDRHPALIARCTSVSDVVAAVRFGRDAGLETGVRCGGHSVLGLPICDDGLVIDLTPLDAVRVDPERRIARVQGGAMLGVLDEAAQRHGLATTAGNVSHTGVGGLTLGGGMGWLARQHGLSCDNLLSVELVTAGGDVLTASETEHPELFWGVRGGGGNFGVVTEFAFRLHPIHPRVLLVDRFFPAEDTAAPMQGWRDLLADAPREATLTAWVGTAGEWPHLPAELHGRPVAAIGYVWAGDPDEGRRLLPTLRSLGPAATERVQEMTYLELQRMDDSVEGHTFRRYWKGHYLRELHDDAIKAFLSRGGGSDFLPAASFQAYGGAISDVADDATAFSQRDALVEFVAAARWDDPAEDEQRIEAARRYAATMEPFASGVYVNVLADEGQSGVSRAYSAAKLARLTALKDRYDPENVFHLTHNVRPSA